MSQEEGSFLLSKGDNTSSESAEPQGPWFNAVSHELHIFECRIENNNAFILDKINFGGGTINC